jgi:hypothetical protein
MSYENPWVYNGSIVDSEVLNDYLGFIYKITNVSTQRMYIGKKLLKRTKTRVLKGKKKKSLVESDWKDYYGSNKELIEDVAKIGAHNFKREILRLCVTKGECNYYEAKMQFDLRVLESGDYYNSWIMVKVHEKHLPKTAG